jgi:hypothetical protein
MSTPLSTCWRVHHRAMSVECSVTDAPAGAQFTIGWSTEDVTVLDAPRDARAAIARSRRVHEELVRDGLADLL